VGFSTFSVNDAFGRQLAEFRFRPRSSITRELQQLVTFRPELQRLVALCIEGLVLDFISSTCDDKYSPFRSNSVTPLKAPSPSHILRHRLISSATLTSTVARSSQATALTLSPSTIRCVEQQYEPFGLRVSHHLEVSLFAVVAVSNLQIMC